MSTKREIKYDAADDVKLNDEVNVDLEDKHSAGVGTTSDGFVGPHLLRVVQKEAPTKSLYKICEKITPWSS